MFEAPRQIRPAIAGAGPGGVALGYLPPAQIDFQKLWLVIWRGKTTIILTTLAALALAVLFIMVAPQKYTAVTEILIDPTDLHAAGGETTPSNQMSDAALLQIESQVRVLTSDAVLRRVVVSEQLAQDPEFVHGPSLLAVLMGRNTLAADNELSALNELKRDVQVKRTERTFVVDVNVTSRDAKKAAHLANAIAAAYLAEQTEVRSDAARQISQTLSARLQDLRDRVRDAEEKVEAFKARNNIVGANGQLVGEQQLTELNNQLGAARARTAEAKARLEQVQAVQRNKDEIGAFPEAVQSPIITALRSQYAEITRRESEQMTTLGARHPAVIEIQAQAERLQRMIDNEVARIAVSARGEYESAKSSQEILAASLDTLKQKTIGTNETLVGLRELEREVQANRTVYESFLVRARETGEQEQLDTKNIRVISRAEPPQRRSSPPSSLLVMLGAMMLGAAAGTGIVFVRPPYEGGPSRKSASNAWGKRLGSRAKGVAPAGTISPAVPVLAVLPAVDVSFGLNAVADPASSYAREIRKIYETVRSSHRKPGNPAVLIASCDDQDDTATVALTLAATAAASERVLLIDADLERRTLAAIDADQSEGGLVDVATGRRMLSDVTVRDRQTNITTVALVAPASRRDRRISDADVRRAFEQTRRYDIVIVAAMDLNRDPGTRFFAGLVDHIVLVARADEDNEAAVEQFISRLGLDARKVCGAVLTGVGAA